jgi:hypothetical protein
MFKMYSRAIQKIEPVPVIKTTKPVFVPPVFNLLPFIGSKPSVVPMAPVVNVSVPDVFSMRTLIKGDSVAAAALGTKLSTTEIVAAAGPLISTPAPGSPAAVISKPSMSTRPPISLVRPLLHLPPPVATPLISDSAPPATTTVPVTVSPSQEADIQKLLATFPDVLDQAITDYAKLKAGLSYSMKNQTQLFTADQLNTITAWFVRFPDLWDTLAPNYDGSTGDPTADQYRSSVKAKAEAFVKKLRGDTVLYPGLGVLPFIIIAGVIIAGLLGVGAAIWAIGYVQQQRNVSAMIDGVVAGKIPADVLDQAITEAQASPLGDLGNILKYAAIGGALILAWPVLSGLLSKIGKRA